jgi:hypothetical protein
MPKPSLKTFSILAVLALGMSAAAFATCTPTNQLSLSVNPATVDRGDTVTISSGIHNCTTHNELVTVKYKLTIVTASGTNSIFLGSVTFPLAAGKSISESHTLFIPAIAPLAKYTIHGSATAGGISVGSASATLSLVANDGD